MEIKLLYADEQLAVCLKPAGTDSEQGVPALLHAALGGDFFCVHRLDKAVGGVMAFARTKQTAAALGAAIAAGGAAIAAGGMEKGYLAVVQGAPDEPSGRMRDLLYHDAARNKSFVVTRPRRGVKEALLDYELIGSLSCEGRTLSALRIALHTGRSHQIRVQFSSRGMPLVGDGRYGSALRGCPLALWSERLCFAHPAHGEELCFSAAPPACFPWTEFSLT